MGDSQENKTELADILSGSATDILNNITSIEKSLLNETQISCPVIHRFGPGVYIRELHMPKGTLAIGHHQNFEHMNIFLKGKVTVLNDDGSTSDLLAPMIFVGKPGRKIGYVHEDVVWLNVYATDEKDIEKIESIFLTKSDAFLDNEKISKLLHYEKRQKDREDFFLAITEMGFTEEQVRSVSVDESDMTDLPHGGYKIKVATSEIEGRGLFATGDFLKGEVIAPARIGDKRTIAGRFTNHSHDPNAEMVIFDDNTVALVAIKDIDGCFGGTDGDEITVDYRTSVKANLEFSMGEKCPA